MKRLTTCLMLLCALTATTPAQEFKPDAHTRAEETQAYRMLYAHKVAAESELEKMLNMYTRSFPAVLSKQYELDLIARETARMIAIESGQLGRLSATYGDMVLRRIALEVEVRDVLSLYTPRHPTVREKLSALSKVERETAEHLR